MGQYTRQYQTAVRDDHSTGKRVIGDETLEGCYIQGYRSQKVFTVLQGNKHIFFSLDVAVFPEHGGTSAGIVTAVDCVLFRPKHQGGDRFLAADSFS